MQALLWKAKDVWCGLYVKCNARNGRLQKANPINLASGSGNLIEIMELGYALQLLSLEEIVKNKRLENGIQNLPENIN